MLALVVDTCTERSVVTLIEDGHCAYFAGLPFGLHQSRYLVPKVEEGFESIGRRPQELDLIVAGVGPGSYTGMRVGATVCKTLSYACKVPLVGVSTLKGFLPDCDGRFAAVIDAKMSGAYLIKGKKEQGLVSYLTNPFICPIEDFENELNDTEILVSPYISNLKKKVNEFAPSTRWLWQETAPDPLHLYHLAHQKHDQGDFTTDGSLHLLYLRDETS